MGNITFSENSQGYLIPMENGVALCDAADPQVQAETWVASHDFNFANEVIVLGLGGGFHIRALQEAHPHLRIHILESRDQLLPIYRKQIRSEITDYNCFHGLEELLHSEIFARALAKSLPVYSFTQGWGAQEDLFYSFWKNLTGRTLYGIVWHLTSMGITVNEAALESLKTLTLPLGVKDAAELLAQHPGEIAQEARTRFEILKEMIR